MLSDQKKINNKDYRKSKSVWGSNGTFLDNKWIKEVLKEIFKYLEWKYNLPKFMRWSEISAYGEIYNTE